MSLRSDESENVDNIDDIVSENVEALEVQHEEDGEMSISLLIQPIDLLSTWGVGNKPVMLRMRWMYKEVER